MSLQLFFLASAATLLFAAILLVREELRRRQEGDTFAAEASESFNSDSLAAELSTQIFRPEDSDFVASETNPIVARAFREGRTILALEWLRGVRGQVGCLFRSHLKAARLNPDLTPIGELRLGFRFLVFQLTTGILYADIRMRGPLRAARLVLLSLDLYEKLLKTGKDILPIPAAAVTAEFLELSPRADHRGMVR